MKLFIDSKDPLVLAQFHQVENPKLHRFFFTDFSVALREFNHLFNDNVKGCDYGSLLLPTSILAGYSMPLLAGTPLIFPGNYHNLSPGPAAFRKCVQPG